LQPNALVHVAYLRLVDESRVECGSRAEFSVAANLMHQVLVNHAKRYQWARRGGGNNVSLEGAVVLAGEPELGSGGAESGVNEAGPNSTRGSVELWKCDSSRA
jgi:hypothetical protein